MKTCIVETDASDFALGAFLSTKDDDARLDPIAFHSRKFQSTEINYQVHDNEILAIIDSVKVRRHYLEVEFCTVMVYSDHPNLDSSRLPRF
jgi:hypothetical protein